MLKNNSSLLAEDSQMISELYDVIYSVATGIIMKYNPCGFRNGRCREQMECCSECDHLSKHGCTVKSLYCRLWLCRQATIRMPECAAALDALAELASRYNLLDEQLSKEKTLIKLGRMKAFDRQCVRWTGENHQA